MNGALLENLKVDGAIQLNSTSSSLRSQSFSMAGYHRAAVVIQVGTIPATGDIVTMSILGGNATIAPASMSSITNATASLRTSSTSGLVSNCAAARINVLGSAIDTAIRTLVVNGITLMGGSNATYATASGGTAVFGFIGAGAASAVAKSLATAIQTRVTNVECTYSGTGTTACALDLVLKNPGATVINISATAQSTISGFNAQSIRTQAIISFTAGDLMSTNSSNTNFSVLVNCTGSSAIPVSVLVVRDPRSAPDFQGWIHKKDLSVSSGV
jgi:hypothetical protein